MMNRKKTAGAFLTAVVASMSLLGVAAPASASTQDPGASDIGDFAEALHVPQGAESAIESAFGALTAEEQDDVLNALATDPASLIEYGEATTTTAPGSDARSVSARAAGTAVVATNTVTAYLLGIPIGNFNIQFKYYVTSTTVTGIIDCQGWFNGIGVTDSVRESSYVISGRGTCNARHTMNFIFKGSPISWNKLHTVTTKSGSPRALAGSLSNV